MRTIAGDRECTPKSGNPGHLPRINHQGRKGSGKNAKLEEIYFCRGIDAAMED